MTQSWLDDTPRVRQATLPRERRGAERIWLTLWIVVSALVSLFMGALDRPIWIDEVLHFALGAFTLDEALKVIHDSTVSVNHGQTGVLMAMNYALLKILGPTTLALRLPSMIAFAALLVCCVQTLRLLGYGRIWQVIVFMGVVANVNLVFHAGVGRPYMILAACTIGTLLYYLDRLRGSQKVASAVLGAGCILVGMSMHPYFPAMYLLVACFAIWFGVRNGQLTAGRVKITEFLNVWVIIFGIVIYFALGLVTWIRHPARFQFDPLESWHGSSLGLARSVIGNHLGILGEAAPIPGLPPLAAISGPIVVSLLLVVLLNRHVRSTIDLAPPIVLWLAAVLSSLGFSMLSARQGYWILPRQWVAGMALTSVATVWIVAVVVEAGKQQRVLASKVLQVVTFGAVALAAGFSLHVRIAEYRDDESFWRALETSLRAGSHNFGTVPTDNEEWEELANLNTLRGEMVTPVFREYYGHES